MEHGEQSKRVQSTVTQRPALGSSDLEQSLRAFWVQSTLEQPFRTLWQLHSTLKQPFRALWWLWSRLEHPIRVYWQLRSRLEQPFRAPGGTGAGSRSYFERPVAPIW